MGARSTGGGQASQLSSFTLELMADVTAEGQIHLSHQLRMVIGAACDGYLWRVFSPT